MGLIASVAGAATVQKKVAAPPAKVSASQLFLRLDAIDKKIDDMTKNMLAAKAPATPAPAPVQVVTTGESPAARGMVQAFYNHGMYGQKAASTRLAAWWIRDIALVAGASMAIVGWEGARNQYQPRTAEKAFSSPAYSLVSTGVITAAIGVVVAEFIKMASVGLDKKAAKCLMEPLESVPEPAGK
jgi:hypothetical protein